MPSDATRLSYYQARQEPLLRRLGLPEPDLIRTEVAPLLSVLPVCAFGQIFGLVSPQVGCDLVQQKHVPFALCYYGETGWIKAAAPFADDQAAFTEAARALVARVQEVHTHE